MESSAVVIAEKISTYLGDHWIHRDLNFMAEKGKITAIIGGSGSGKSTLLRELLGLLKPHSGHIKIFGEDILKTDPKKLNKIQRSFGVLFQQSALFSSLNILDNILFPLQQFTPLDQKTMVELALLKLSLVGLTSDVAYKFPSELSGGMQKRAALARALILDPTLLFLDEPSSGLDPVSAKAQDKLLLDFKSSLNLSIILVTHDMNTLENIVDEIVFLGEKKVLAKGSFEALRKNSHPAIQAYFHDVCAATWGSQ